ncbi:MAG: ATP-binding cassette domain-containing protein [Planctomycetota bacterium]
MKNGGPVVELVGVEKTYRDFWGRPRIRALEPLTLSLEPGEILALLGPNGAGKSTTIKLILGLLFPTRGLVRVFGGTPRDPANRARLGYLPEETRLHPFLTPRETLDFFGRLHGLSRPERRRRTEQSIAMVGLGRNADRPVGEFSKGMSRRIGLAVALTNDPDLLILDEPTSGLDPLGTREIKDLIQALGGRGRSVLLSSHLLDDVEDVADRIAILYGGKLRRVGTTQELLARTGRLRFEVEAGERDPASAGAAVGAALGTGEVAVSVPADRLESLFRRVVEEAEAGGVATAGATRGGPLAEFLGGGAEGAQVVVGSQPPPAEPQPSLAERVASPAPSPAERVASLRPSPAERVANPAPSPAERVANPAPSPAERVASADSRGSAGALDISAEIAESAEIARTERGRVSAAKAVHFSAEAQRRREAEGALPDHHRALDSDSDSDSGTGTGTDSDSDSDSASDSQPRSRAHEDISAISAISALKSNASAAPTDPGLATPSASAPGDRPSKGLDDTDVLPRPVLQADALSALLHPPTPTEAEPPPALPSLAHDALERLRASDPSSAPAPAAPARTSAPSLADDALARLLRPSTTPHPASAPLEIHLEAGGAPVLLPLPKPASRAPDPKADAALARILGEKKPR